MYKKTKCRIINDNNLSHFFDVKRGVRQGDPLSLTIFVLCIEYLAEMLRKSKEHQGFKINSHCFKVSLFAYDTVIYLNGNASQFNYVFDILKYFGNKSGCKVNLNKSSAFYLGSSKGINFRPFLSSGLSWPDSSIKYLGVNISVNNFDELSLFEENFANVIYDMQSILNFWSARGLPLLEKITILKTLIIPKIIYKASLLPIHLPEKFVKELNKLMFKFIWDSKWEKISRSKLSCSIEEGRAKMIDKKQYFLALKFRHIGKLFNKNYSASWKIIENLCLPDNLFFCVLRSNCRPNNMIVNNLISLRFSKSALKTPEVFLDASDEIKTGNKFLWFSKVVKYQNKPTFNDEFFSAGIHDFYQLVKTNGDLFSYDEIAINFRINPNNHSFIKYIKLISALPINWLNETCISSTMPNFNEFKEKMLTQIELLSTSNKTAYAFLRKKFKDIPSKQQIKWCESLQISSNFINWKAIYENNWI